GRPRPTPPPPPHGGAAARGAAAPPHPTPIHPPPQTPVAASLLEAPLVVERHPPRTYARWTGIATLVVALFAAGSLWTETGSRSERHHVPTPDAREAYVKGRYFLDQRSIRGWQQALEQFER